MPAFTARSVELLKPDPEKRLELPDSALPGFYLVVQPSGAKSWAVRYRADGKPKKLTLGPYPRLGLGDARERARTALQAVSEGRDPAGEKAADLQEQAAATRLTFGAVAADFVARYAKPRNRSWPETERLLTKADLEPWQARDVRGIGRRDVLDVIDGVVERGAPIHANRLFAALRKMFGWAVERGVLDASPMAALKPPSPEVARDRVLSDVELAAVWKAAAEVGYPFGTVVQLLILTGQRRSEVLDAEWREIDRDGRMWTIPRQRAKNDRAHAVPLSDAALGILDALPRIGKPARFLFTTTGSSPFSGVSKATERLSKLAAKHMPDAVLLEPWRLHDLRRTFASGCARLGVGIHVVEKALNHTSGTFGGIVGVYQLHDFADERRQALDNWASHLMVLLDNPRSTGAMRGMK
ncbi:Prophage integrase IntS [Methylobacterium cerastii]|uniref:Prophage integrase IntS n=1 Tax=Methylobacterium cerastii TaxID=932741 RepID=A0ABQ4QLK4_9HYPH|nr:site-specific integrase [Methylobacterium cerastii]GJD46107.1 Prophage integrase IntS [Methylobacterium cerastii]